MHSQQGGDWISQPSAVLVFDILDLSGMMRWALFAYIACVLCLAVHSTRGKPVSNLNDVVSNQFKWIDFVIKGKTDIQHRFLGFAQTCREKRGQFFRGYTSCPAFLGE